MEFGARALGSRCIFANPCDPQMKSRLNKVIKKREGFRPFAPICKREALTTYFEYDSDIPYMNQVVKVVDRFINKLPSITHVDKSSRVQTLTNTRARYVYQILGELEKLIGFPIVINTSFNLKDQTMVLTPEDAIKTFLNCEMDVLILGSYVVRKKIR
jgi:carbamoyltransferase